MTGREAKTSAAGMRPPSLLCPAWGCADVFSPPSGQYQRAWLLGRTAGVGLADSLPGGHAVLHCPWREGPATSWPALRLGMTQTMAALVGGQPCLIVTFVCHAVGTVLRNPAQVLTSQLGPCFGTLSVQVFCPFLFGLLVFLLLSFKSSSYILGTSPLSDVFLQILSPRLRLVFSFQRCLPCSRRFSLAEVQLVHPVLHE